MAIDGDEADDLREDLRGFPFDKKMGVDEPLVMGGRGDEEPLDVEDDPWGDDGEVDLGKGTAAGSWSDPEAFWGGVDLSPPDIDMDSVGRVCSSRESGDEEWSSSS